MTELAAAMAPNTMIVMTMPFLVAIWVTPFMAFKSITRVKQFDDSISQSVNFFKLDHFNLRNIKKMQLFV
jgi:hypothetical protein